ncbi:MAG: 2Fe-2S iron-sulfur cluster-binding protein [Chloroflexota bacterium]|nr:2Fe-2S iron-sulfur cluster-binding protein [Chloroflexota bacterium]
MPTSTHYIVTVLIDNETQALSVPAGGNLRRALIGAGISPYAALTKKLNCGGRGICATCGVWFEAGEPAPVHWHDQMAARFGYPRLSCQVTVENDMTVRMITEKVIWGMRDPARRFVTE